MNGYSNVQVFKHEYAYRKLPQSSYDKFFSKKVNRRVDRLIYILIGPIQTHFVRKERSNAFEMNGPSPKKFILERETELAELIPATTVVRKSEATFEISTWPIS